MSLLNMIEEANDLNSYLRENKLDFLESFTDNARHLCGVLIGESILDNIMEGIPKYIISHSSLLSYVHDFDNNVEVFNYLDDITEEEYIYKRNKIFNNSKSENEEFSVYRDFMYNAIESFNKDIFHRFYNAKEKVNLDTDICYYNGRFHNNFLFINISFETHEVRVEFFKNNMVKKMTDEYYRRYGVDVVILCWSNDKYRYFLNGECKLSSYNEINDCYILADKVFRNKDLNNFNDSKTFNKIVEYSLLDINSDDFNDRVGQCLSTVIRKNNVHLAFHSKELKTKAKHREVFFKTCNSLFGKLKDKTEKQLIRKYLNSVGLRVCKVSNSFISSKVNIDIAIDTLYFKECINKVLLDETMEFLVENNYCDKIVDNRF